METFTFIVPSSFSNIETLSCVVLSLSTAVFLVILFRLYNPKETVLLLLSLLFMLGSIVVTFYFFDELDKAEYVAKTIIDTKERKDLIPVRLGSDDIQLENKDSIFIYSYKIVSDSICIVNLSTKIAKSLKTNKDE